VCAVRAVVGDVRGRVGRSGRPPHRLEDRSILPALHSPHSPLSPPSPPRTSSCVVACCAGNAVGCSLRRGERRAALCEGRRCVLRKHRLESKAVSQGGRFIVITSRRDTIKLEISRARCGAARSRSGWGAWDSDAPLTECASSNETGSSSAIHSSEIKRLGGFDSVEACVLAPSHHIHRGKLKEGAIPVPSRGEDAHAAPEYAQGERQAQQLEFRSLAPAPHAGASESRRGRRVSGVGGSYRGTVTVQRKAERVRRGGLASGSGVKWPGGRRGAALGSRRGFPLLCGQGTGA
jgi:hypothetical protein